MRGLYRREETRRSRNESEGSFRGQPDCPPYILWTLITLLLKLCRGFRPLIISMAMALQYLISLLNASASSKLTLDADRKQQMFRCDYYHAYIHSDTSIFNSAVIESSITLPTITTIMAELRRQNTLFTIVTPCRLSIQGLSRQKNGTLILK